MQLVGLLLGFSFSPSLSLPRNIDIREAIMDKPKYQGRQHIWQLTGTRQRDIEVLKHTQSRRKYSSQENTHNTRRHRHRDRERKHKEDFKLHKAPTHTSTRLCLRHRHRQDKTISFHYDVWKNQFHMIHVTYLLFYQRHNLCQTTGK